MLSNCLQAIRVLGFHHAQSATNSLILLWRNPLVTAITVIVIAITLSLPVVFGLLSDNIRLLINNWQYDGRIDLYLKDKLPSEVQKSLLIAIKQFPGVQQVILKTAADSLTELQQQAGMHDIMQYLNANPLPDIIKITPDTTCNQPEKLANLLNSLHNLTQVDQNKFDTNWIVRLYILLNFVKKITYILMSVLSMAVILIISNTLCLAVHHRADEVRVLKLIGATDVFIARGFLYSGLWYGLLGAVLAILLVNIFMLVIDVVLQELIQVYQIHNYSVRGLSVLQAYQVVLVAIMLGWLSSQFAVKKQLALI